MRLEELGGDLLRRLIELAGCSSEACLPWDVCFEGVPTTLTGRDASDFLFEGVWKDEDGVSKSKRPSTRPFFCGVGPIAFRCEAGVFPGEAIACSGITGSS